MHPFIRVLPILIVIVLLFILLAIPLTLGLVPRNPWYGVRTPQTMHGTEAEWYASNRRGGEILLGCSFTALVVLSGIALLKH